MGDVHETQSAELAQPPLAVLGTAAKNAYREALRNGVLALPPTGAEHDAQRAAAGELLGLGLLLPAPGRPDELLPVDPRIAEARLGSAWRARALELLDRASDLGDELAPFIEEYREPALPAEESPGSERLSGSATVNWHLDQALSSCREELLTAQPGGGRPVEFLQEALDRDHAVLRRGAAMRTLYLHSARFDGPTREYVEGVRALGGQVRTLADLFERLIVVDRRIAFVPAPDHDGDAIVVRDPAVVHYLADVFDRSWQRASEFPTGQEPAAAPYIADETRRAIVQLLIEGESEASIARRVGLSKRSCAAHIAKLKQNLGVQTLFQLGYRVAATGLSSVDIPAGGGPDTSSE
ncbi:LuxR family transcriptional regulator [Streptomyces angustmyceticus]|uniref:HTH luxR-type domain-containing protein n=1 Tax=Streptomyces angustmyceticus TaxID=285578 RepID=A0A5J4LT43_9ACTN|nr:hypothetical protein [Streptomyces angustmyceticus]UAL65928.1 LuxR family transcriptional regulator [Streptomyces angustmyceticus]GES33545.1 hypothetical protein San01_60330 [Streptomyces angustmyceticus]